MQNNFSPSRKILGIGAVIGASMLFGLGYTLGDIITAEGMSETCNGLWTALFGILGNLTVNLIRGNNPFQKLPAKQMLLCILAGFAALWFSNYLFLVAYKYMEVAEVTMLHFLYPSFIAIVMTCVFHEKFTKAKFAAIISSIIGMLIITGGFRLGHPVGLAAAIGTGITYALYPILLETTSLGKVESSTLLLYMNMTSGLSSLIISLATGRFMFPVNATVLGCQIAVSLTSLSGFLLTAYGVKVIGATNASFGSMMEPIISCIFAAVLLRQAIGANIYIGAVFVILSIMFTSIQDLPAKRIKSARNDCEHGKAQSKGTPQ